MHSIRAACTRWCIAVRPRLLYGSKSIVLVSSNHRIFISTSLLETKAGHPFQSHAARWSGDFNAFANKSLPYQFMRASPDETAPAGEMAMTLTREWPNCATRLDSQPAEAVSRTRGGRVPERGHGDERSVVSSFHVGTAVEKGLGFNGCLKRARLLASRSWPFRTRRG